MLMWFPMEMKGDYKTILLKPEDRGFLKWQMSHYVSYNLHLTSLIHSVKSGTIVVRLNLVLPQRSLRSSVTLSLSTLLFMMLRDPVVTNLYSQYL